MLSLSEPIHAGSLAGNVGTVLALSAGAKSHVCAYQVKHLFTRIPVRTREKKWDADKKKSNLKTLGNNGATSENRDGQTAYLTAENLGVKVTVFADTGSDFSAIPRSAVEDARKRGFPPKVEVLSEPIMLNMAIRGEGDK
jgi:hypothetical protein